MRSTQTRRSLAPTRETGYEKRVISTRRSQRQARLPLLLEVLARTGLSRSTTYVRLDYRGAFRGPVSMGGRAAGWIESEAEEWICQRVAESGNGEGIVAWRSFRRLGA